MRFTADLLRDGLRNPALVQSFSGIRARFGMGPDISDDLAALAAAYGYFYASCALKDGAVGRIVIGRDPRPTGAAISRCLCLGFLAGAAAKRASVRFLDMGIITTPLIQTAVRSLQADGGVMITASHNPLHDNGFKFITGAALADVSPISAPPGALLSAADMNVIVQAVSSAAADGSTLESAFAAIIDTDLEAAAGDGEDHQDRIFAERAYLDTIGRDWGIQPHCLKPLVYGPALLDPNGGAACGIGARVLEHFGVRAIEVNAEPGYPEHGIDTDGIDPASGKHMLIRVARAALRNSAGFGVAFDYDADRGNLVLPGLDENAIIPPQTLAAANIGLALVHRRLAGVSGDNLAVVVSDATSGGSVEVARIFGAEVFTVETGEINVVTKMHRLRQQGYDVPVGVEGANGGTIFGSSTCRDGIYTAICAALGDEHPEMAREWLRLFNQRRDKSGYRLPDILASTPVYFNRMLKLEGLPASHSEVKSSIERCFSASIWPRIQDRYQSYRFHNYEGTEEVDSRSGDESGGWRVSLSSPSGTSFIFARGSRTESGVWRMIVDSPDAASGEELLAAAGSLYDAAKR